MLHGAIEYLFFCSLNHASLIPRPKRLTGGVKSEPFKYASMYQAKQEAEQESEGLDGAASSDSDA
jgi:hypothetical protein